VTPRPAEKMVLKLARGAGARTFLQIGVNDGVYGDPMNLAVRGGFIHGALVEPQPHFFDKMQETYRGVSGMEYFNHAISDKPGILPIFGFDPKDSAIPAWLHGSASLDRDQLLRFVHRVPDVAAKIVEYPVEILTVPALLDVMTIKNPDIITVDAEGHDATILRQFDFEAMRPMMVIYEIESLREGEKSEINQRLTMAGYDIHVLGQDAVAVRSGIDLAD